MRIQEIPMFSLLKKIKNKNKYLGGKEHKPHEPKHTIGVNIYLLPVNCVLVITLAIHMLFTDRSCCFHLGQWGVWINSASLLWYCCVLSEAEVTSYLHV